MRKPCHKGLDTYLPGEIDSTWTCGGDEETFSAYTSKFFVITGMRCVWVVRCIKLSVYFEEILVKPTAPGHLGFELHIISMLDYVPGGERCCIRASPASSMQQQKR